MSAQDRPPEATLLSQAVGRCNGPCPWRTGDRPRRAAASKAALSHQAYGRALLRLRRREDEVHSYNLKAHSVGVAELISLQLFNLLLVLCCLDS